MGLWDKITGEFIDIIEWLDDSNDTLAYRFQRYDNEIKYGAQLTVREGQIAAFVNEGQLADIFQPGRYKLETQNLPILSTLKGWKYGFSSPFKAEVYFISTRQFTDQKWGTANPIMLRDPEFGPVRLRAFGTYAFRTGDPAVLLREVVGTDGHFTVDEIDDQLRNLIVSHFPQALAGSGIPMLDLAANYGQLGEQIAAPMCGEFSKLGLQLTTLLIENISLPPEVEEALDKRASMGVIGNMQQFTQFQAANALETAAANEGGGGIMAAAGMTAGMGMAIGGQVAQTMQGGAAAAPPPLPPSLPAANVSSMVAAGQVTAATLVWSQGMPGWVPAGQVPELATFFASQPPPLPPGGGGD